MRFNKAFAYLTVAVGMALPGASVLGAQDWHGYDSHGYDSHQDRRDIRSDYRDVRNDHETLERMQADVARDHARLNEAIRRGDDREAAELAADLARDQRAFDAQVRDIQHDRRDVRSDRQDFRRDDFRRGF